MTQAGKAVIDQQEGTEAGASGDDLGAPFSLLVLCEERTYSPPPSAGGGMACGHRARGSVASPPPAGIYNRRQQRLVHRAELRRCTGGLGAIGHQQAAPGIYLCITCYYCQGPY